jgi:glycosyltransferase involved in cell wall biosynthesis
VSAREQDLRVAIAHEWLVRYAGSERCVAEMVRAFPDARLLTTLIVPEALPAALRSAEPSFLQRIPGSTGHHEWLLPLMPAAWRLRAPIAEVDAVISSAHACAKAVRVEPGIPHLCYCHTPMRYAWDFESEAWRFPPGLRRPARVAMRRFRRWDARTASNVDRFVANSRAVADRIQRFYDRPAQVIHPPVRTEFFTAEPQVERTTDFLYVGRLVSYKRADLAVEAFARLPFRLLVVGRGQMEAQLRRTAASNVVFVGETDDAELRDLYRRCRALVYPADEDFGIVMAEAQACGLPVIGLDRGGARDIVDNGETGWLLSRQELPELVAAISRAADEDLDSALISARAQRFSSDRFRQDIRGAVEDLVAASGRPRRTSFPLG